jgi:tetratricopeptide (TPR) repeat protein
MKKATSLLALVFLFAVWPAQGQAPTTAGAYNDRGLARFEKGDLDGAISDYTTAIEIDPRYTHAYYNRGIARRAKGDLDGAIADYNKYIEMEPRDADGYYKRGVAREAKGDLDGAIADYNKYIEMEPRDAFAYTNRGFARKAKGDLDGAISDYTTAIEIYPRFAAAYNSLAWLCATSPREAVRDGKKAVEYARKVAELTNWQDPDTLDTLAAAYAEAGNFEEAIKWENKALTFPEFAKNSGEAARLRLQLYTERKPYREK